MPLHIIGGFGDVTIGRKLKFLLLNKEISSVLGLISILDTYPDKDKIKRNPRDYLENTVKPNFKTPVEDIVLDALADRIKSGGIQYFVCDKEGKDVNEFFRQTNEGEIIDISTPNLFHLSYLERAAMETLAHITLEKPAVTSREEIEKARKIIEYQKRINPLRIFMDQEHYSHYEMISQYIKNIKKTVGNLGKIRTIKIELKENEGFESPRNKGVINKEMSGGGIWLDLGPHALSFITSLEAKIDKNTILATRYKYSDPVIADEKYRETRLETSFYAESPFFIEGGAKIDIAVGKAANKTRKVFEVQHINGKVTLNTGEKKYSYQGREKVLDKQEPFLNSYKDLISAVKNHRTPINPIEKSLKTLENLFEVQTIAETKPMISYDFWSEDATN